MAKKSFQEIVNFYLQRFAFQKPVLMQPVHPHTNVIVTIPCHKEKQLLSTLESLNACDLPEGITEVIVIINASEKADQNTININTKAFDEAKQWIEKNSSEKLRFYIITNNQLPKKDAGVGLARKIVMDEALYRLSTIDNDGVILCLDADCLVQKNYLQVIEAKFRDKQTKSASIYYEHLPAETSVLDEGIKSYELFLRYYVQGLKYANYPFAFHTIGSSMAVSANTYALSGGMNRKKAGEDFYFLHKVSHLGTLTEINDTTVFPSSRISDRVPFGTGKAQEKWMQNPTKVLSAYDSVIFEELKVFFSFTNLFFEINKEDLLLIFDKIPVSIQSFFGDVDTCWKIISGINQNTKKLSSFLKRYYSYFDGLRVLKIVHFLRDNFYPDKTILEASKQLLEKKDIKNVSIYKIDELLTKYRDLDKRG